MCVCDEYGAQAIYIHNNQVCTFMHMYVLCENSDSVRNKNTNSLRGTVCVCTCVYVCSFMHMYAL